MSANGSKPLAGQAALVTGGGGGIGGASAAWLARDGAAVRGGGHFLGDLVEQDLQIQGLKASS